MDALYPYVKTLHILFAIIAVGFNASYAVWLVRGQRDPAHLAFAVKGVKFMDDYIANPCYLLLLLSGLAMAFVAGHWGFQRWIVAALILWVILMGLIRWALLSAASLCGSRGAPTPIGAPRRFRWLRYAALAATGATPRRRAPSILQRR